MWHETPGAAKCLESPSTLMSIVSPECNSLSLHSIYNTQPSHPVLFFLVSLLLQIAAYRVYCKFTIHSLHTASSSLRSLPQASSAPNSFSSTKKPRNRPRTWLNSPSTDCVGPKSYLAQCKRPNPHTISQPTGANPHLSAQRHGSQASPTTAKPSSAQSPAASLTSHPE